MDHERFRGFNVAMVEEVENFAVRPCYVFPRPSGFELNNWTSVELPVSIDSLQE